MTAKWSKAHEQAALYCKTEEGEPSAEMTHSIKHRRRPPSPRLQLVSCGSYYQIRRRRDLAPLRRLQESSYCWA